jgi:hypothetical protein
MPLLTVEDMANLCARYDDLERQYKRATGLGYEEYSRFKECEKEILETVRKVLEHVRHTESAIGAAILASFNTWALLRGGFPS